jgi:hypothetical protein
VPNLREDQAVIHVSVDGVNPPFVPSGWSSFSGGDVEAQNVKLWPGGMLPQQDLGGPPTRSDATVQRPYSDALHPYLVQFENVAGRAGMQIIYQPKDANGNPIGGVYTIKGKLKTVTRPNYEASATNPAYLTLVMSCDFEAHLSD